MGGVMLLAKAELLRLRRNRRYLILTVMLPVVLYLLVARQVSATAYGVTYKAFYMVAMATLGSFSGSLLGNAQRISQEKKEGWIRQLRLTPLPANAYVISKIIVAMATTLPAILIVLLLGRFYGGVHMAAWQWLAIFGTIWFGASIFSALAVALGYKFLPDQVQAIGTIIYFVFAIFGGLWFPLDGVLKQIGEVTPTYAAVKIGTDVIGGASVAPGLILSLFIWLAVFAGLATLAVRSTGETVLPDTADGSGAPSAGLGHAAWPAYGDGMEASRC